MKPLFQFIQIVFCVLLLFQISLAEANKQVNETKTTSDLLILVGSKSNEYLKHDTKTNINGLEMYVVMGSISLISRPISPVSVEVWGQGVNDIVFFEFPTIEENKNEFIQKPATLEEIKTLFDAGCKTPIALDSWSTFFEHLKCSKKLLNVLEIQSLPPSTQKRIGYVFKVPSESAKKWEGKINISANGTKPESVTITGEVGTEQGFSALLPTLLTSVITLVTGAALALGSGYLVFRLQQGLLLKIEQEKKFIDKKIENSELLFDFFKKGGNYSTLYESSDDVKDKIPSIINFLIGNGIYVMIPQDSAKEILKIYGSTCMENSHLEALNEIIKKHFGEFINLK